MSWGTVSEVERQLIIFIILHTVKQTWKLNTFPKVSQWVRVELDFEHKLYGFIIWFLTLAFKISKYSQKYEKPNQLRTHIIPLPTKPFQVLDLLQIHLLLFSCSALYFREANFSRRHSPGFYQGQPVEDINTRSKGRRKKSQGIWATSFQSLSRSQVPRFLRCGTASSPLSL